MQISLIGFFLKLLLRVQLYQYYVDALSFYMDA